MTRRKISNKVPVKPLSYILVAGILGYLSYSWFYNMNNTSIESEVRFIESNLLKTIGFNDENEPVYLNKILSEDKTNVIFIYTLGCGGCIKDISMLNKLVIEYKKTYKFTGLIYEPDLKKIDALKNNTKLDFTNLRIDDTAVKNLRVDEWPKILVVREDKKIRFISSGDLATQYLSEKL